MQLNYIVSLYMNFDLYKKYSYENLSCKAINKIMKIKNILGGSGGSNNIIYVGHEKSNKDNKFVIKLIPRYKIKMYKIQPNGDQNEIKFYTLFTNNFVLKNKTPHIVTMYNYSKCDDIKKIITFKCPTMDEMLHKRHNDFIERFCMNDNKQHTLLNKCNILMLEYCPINLSDYVDNIFKKKNLIDKLHEIIFQIAFTLSVIRDKYPTFYHRDFFVRNILGHIEDRYEKNDYVKYVYHEKVFYLKANGFISRINDFGMSIMKDIKNSTIKTNIKYNKSDFFNFLYDLYDGNNLGSTSLKKMAEGNKIKFSLIRKYFKKFMDMKKLDKMIKINKNIIDWNWNIENIKSLRSIIKTPEEYLLDGTFSEFMELPTNGKVIKIYNHY